MSEHRREDPFGCGKASGYPNEWWLNISRFRGYRAGETSTLSGAAVNIAAALDHRLSWCAQEGRDAVEADDLDGYTNRSATGAKGGGWGLTQADSAGFERWIAYRTHADGLAIFEKNDPAKAAVHEPMFDGVVTEEYNFYEDPGWRSTVSMNGDKAYKVCWSSNNKL